MAIGASVSSMRGAWNWPLTSIVRLHASPPISSTCTRPSARRIVSGYGSITRP